MHGVIAWHAAVCAAAQNVPDKPHLIIPYQVLGQQLLGRVAVANLLKVLGGVLACANVWGGLKRVES